MKEGCLSKLTITKTGYQATQFKKVKDVLPVLCVDKNYRYIGDIVCTWTKLPEAAFLPPYPDQALWSDTYNIEITTVNPTATPDTTTSERPVMISLV